MTKLIPEIMPRYLERFFGCGNLDAPIWFIGMEPGESLDVDSTNRKLAWWDEIGQPHTRDVLPLEIEGKRKHFRCEKPPLQRTVQKLIRALLASKGSCADEDSIRDYQAWQWGLPDGDAATPATT